MESNNAEDLLNDVCKASDNVTGLESVDKHERECELTRILANQSLGDTPNECILQQHNRPVSDIRDGHDHGIGVDLEMFGQIEE